MNTWWINSQDYIKNNFIIDYADCTDYQDYLKNCFIKNTVTTLIHCLLWLCRLRWYSTLCEKYFHHRLHWLRRYERLLRCYERLLLIINSSMTTLIFKRKPEIVITDYVDYPVLHITITYTGIFSRKFSVVLHASLTQFMFCWYC